MESLETSNTLDPPKERFYRANGLLVRGVVLRPRSSGEPAICSNQLRLLLMEGLLYAKFNELQLDLCAGDRLVIHAASCFDLLNPRPIFLAENILKISEHFLIRDRPNLFKPLVSCSLKQYRAFRELSIL